MKVEVRFVGMRASQPLFKEAKVRIESHLQRPDFALTSVSCRLLEVSGPGGGGEKECLLIARGPLGETIVKATRESAYAAIGLAVHRAHHALARAARTTKDRARLRRWRESQLPPFKAAASN